MREPFYFFLLFIGILLLVYWGYRKLKPNRDSVSGLEAMTMNEDHYHTPASGDTIAAIRDKRDGAVPVKRELDPNPGGLVATNFGGPKFNRHKRERVEPAPSFDDDVKVREVEAAAERERRRKLAAEEKPARPVEWPSNRTPRKNRGFMSEPPRPPANDTSDNLGVPLTVALVASELGLFDPVVAQAAEEERPVPAETRVPEAPEPREPDAPDAPDSRDFGNPD